MIQRRLLNALFLLFALTSLSAQGWEAIQAEKFDGSGFPVNLQGMQGFHAVGFVRGTYGSTGLPGDLCALLQPYASGSLIAMQTNLEPGFEYRLKLQAKAFGQGQKLRFSFHTAPSSGGAAAGPDIALPSIGMDDPSLPGTEVASAAFTVDAAGTYWAIAQALGDSPSGWVRYDDMVLERRPVEGCPSVAGPDREICLGDTVQLGTGCLPDPHPLDSLEYCYHWMPETGLDDLESARPNATPQETTAYSVFVTTSQGELVAEDEVTVTVNTAEVRILPEDPSLCYRDMPGARPGREAPASENRASSCTQDFVALSLDGASTAIQWSTGSTGDSIEVYEPGFYSVSVTDANGCPGSAEVEVGMCTATPLAITASSPQLCEDTVMLSVDGAFAAYAWSDGSTSPVLQATAAGVYAVTVEDNGGCLAIDSITIEECNPIVDIQIFNGFYDWATDTSWSGGQIVPDAIESSKGAVTVANLNDTDGDTIPDYQDMSVTASPAGRNEIDLMKLLVLKPQPSGGSLKLRVLEGGQRVKIWKMPTKEDSLASSSPNEYSLSFVNAPDSLTYYLEATNHSDTLRDIVIEASYYGKKDTVAATAFWVDSNNVWFNRSIPPQPTFAGVSCDCPPTTIPAPDPAIQLSECGTYRRINCGWIANDMTRYGFGPCRRESINSIPTLNFPGDASSNNKWLAGRIFWEFRIVPTLTAQQYDDLNLTFDVTRQKQINTCQIVSGGGLFSNCDQDMFPWLAQQDNEKANDDDGQGGLGQNDNTPSPTGLIYSFDPPGSDLYDIQNDNLAFKIYRATFKEFVRMKINLFQTNNINGPENTLEGSRSSTKMDWHTTFHLRRFSNGLYKMELDTANVSVSFPVKGSNSGSNGTITLKVEDSTAVTTNGYRMDFDYFGGKWSIHRMVNGSPATTITISEGPSGAWTQVFDGISITIIQGGIPFALNDRFTYSTFASQNPQGKVNQLNISNQPFNVFAPF
ncbi:MAG: hypothetical protein H6573_24480 [Lewinellaceae bacterium]|nr:hypothetical protein [Lewinellaceae bacterium]